MEAEPLQQIPVVPLLPSARTGRSLLQWLRQRDFIFRAFGFGFLGSLLVNLALCVALLVLLRTRVQFVALTQSGICFVGEGVSLAEARELHEEIAESAATVLLSRGPDGFRAASTLPRLFSPATRMLAEQLRENEQADFKQRQLRQSAEVGHIDVRTSQWSGIEALVTGQLIRTGSLAGQPVNEVVPFTLRLNLSANPDLLRAARYPLIVTTFTLSYESQPRP
jgi:hypothetical protein